MLLTLLLDPPLLGDMDGFVAWLGRAVLVLLLIGLGGYWGLRLWSRHIGKQFEREPLEAPLSPADPPVLRMPRTRYWVAFTVSMALLWLLVLIVKG